MKMEAKCSFETSVEFKRITIKIYINEKHNGARVPKHNNNKNKPYAYKRGLTITHDLVCHELKCFVIWKIKRVAVVSPSLLENREEPN
jgi:hypothetical protein